MNDRLYVGNLSFHTSEDALRDAFGEYDTVADARVILDRETGRSRGFGFVTMESGDAARRDTARVRLDAALARADAHPIDLRTARLGLDRLERLAPR